MSRIKLIMLVPLVFDMQCMHIDGIVRKNIKVFFVMCIINWFDMQHMHIEKHHV